MMEWMPIESAPRDGTIIDLWIVPPEKMGREPYRVVDCWWEAAQPPYEGGVWSYLYNGEGMPVCTVYVDGPERVTHWMPLPPPPLSDKD